MTIAAHPRAVADAADGTVISIITEDNGVRNIFRGKDGFLSGDVRGKLFIEMSTLQPMTGRELAPLVEAAGARLIDSPVLGTIPTARDGKLFAHGRRQGRGPRARPAGAGKAHPQDRAHGAERRGLRHEARGQSRARRLHPGDGGIARARHPRGLSMQQMLDVLGEAPTANGWFAAKKRLLAGRARRRHARPENAAQGHDVGGRDRRAVGTAMPLSTGVLTALSAAVAQGWGDKDIGELARFFREHMGQKFARLRAWPRRAPADRRCS